MEPGAELYQRYLDGDRRAFDAIIETYSPALIAFCNRFVQDENAAEDIAIDALADLLVHPHRFNFTVSLKTYLFMLGRSRAINYARRRGRFQMVPLEEAAAVAGRLTPEEQLLSQEAATHLQKALDALPESMRLAIHLVCFQEMNYTEAAAVMKKTPKQVDNLLYRARKKLREALQKEGA